MNLNGTIINLNDVSTIKPHEFCMHHRGNTAVLHSIIVTLRDGDKDEIHYDSKEQMQADIYEAGLRMDKIERATCY